MEASYAGRVPAAGASAEAAAAPGLPWMVRIATAEIAIGPGVNRRPIARIVSRPYPQAAEPAPRTNQNSAGLIAGHSGTIRLVLAAPAGSARSVGSS